MLPKRHVIVHARAQHMGHYVFKNQAPTTVMKFGDYESEVSLETFLGEIQAFPKNVLLTGNPLHQNLDFLQLALVDLTNNGHIVTVSDIGDRLIPWKITMPGVVFVLEATRDFSYKNYRKLGPLDTVVFANIYDEAAYQIARGQIQHIQQERLSECQFKLAGLWENLTQQVLDDKLEVIANRSV